jgi:dihydrolipoamide dehydrogenase
MKSYDLIVIGAGPGGYVAAIRAAQLGLKTCIIEANHLGGICLNWGCIPTKALLKCSEVNYTLSHLADYGFSAEKIKFDFTKIIERSRKVASQLSGGIKALLKKNKIDVIDGFGKLTSKTEVSISKNGKEIEKINGKYIIVGTGARARILSGFEPDGEKIWTYREAMVPTELPKSIIVIGSGAIGCEFASFYANMGSKVTLLEGLNKILPVEDAEISALASKAFQKQGITIETGIKLESISKTSKGIKLKYSGKELEAEKLIMAVGVVPNTEGIGFETLGIKLNERKLVEVNQFLQTNVPNIFAIGDIVEGPWLAHKASHEGVIAAEKIASLEGKYELSKIHSINRSNIPGCTYTRPQIASLGLTEEKALEKGYKIKVGRFSSIGNGKSIASGETEGLIKTIFDEKTGELLGVHMIGAEVTELISTFALGKQMEATEEDFMHTIFPHPSLSEMIHESVLDAFGKVIHM